MRVEPGAIWVCLGCYSVALIPSQRGWNKGILTSAKKEVCLWVEEKYWVQQQENSTSSAVMTLTEFNF